jgi:hypothetical protein
MISDCFDDSRIKYIEEIHEDLKCQICLNIAKNPCKKKLKKNFE